MLQKSPEPSKEHLTIHTMQMDLKRIRLSEKKKNTVSKGMYCVIPLHNTPEIKKSYRGQEETSVCQELRMDREGGR